MNSSVRGLNLTAIGDPLTALVAVLMTDRLLPMAFATNARLPSGVSRALCGRAPAGIGTVATTVLLAVLITDTLSLEKFAT